MGNVPGAALFPPEQMVYCIPSQAATCDTASGKNKNIPALIPAMNDCSLIFVISSVSPGRVVNLKKSCKLCSLIASIDFPHIRHPVNCVLSIVDLVVRFCILYMGGRSLQCICPSLHVGDINRRSSLVGRRRLRCHRDRL